MAEKLRETGGDPRLEDESKLAEIRRRIEEVATDAPTLAKIALEAIIRKHNPDLKGTAVGELTGHLRDLAADAEGRGAIARRTLAGAVGRLAGSAREIADHARVRGGQLDQGLRGLDLADDVVDGDAVARLHADRREVGRELRGHLGGGTADRRLDHRGSGLALRLLDERRARRDRGPRRPGLARLGRR